MLDEEHAPWTRQTLEVGLRDYGVAELEAAQAAAEMLQSYLDATKARRKLGWDIDTGMKRARVRPERGQVRQSIDEAG